MGEATEVRTGRQRRRARVRRELCETATRLFNEKGYAATTVEEIAAAVHYSASTFHRHFARKEDAAFHEAPRFASEMEARLRPPAAGDPWAVVTETLLGFAVTWDEGSGIGPASARLFLSVPELRARWLEMTEDTAEVISAFLAREYGRAVPDPWCLAAGKAIMLAGRSAIELQVAHGGALVQHLRATLSLVEAGLAPELSAAGQMSSAEATKERKP